MSAGGREVVIRTRIGSNEFGFDCALSVFRSMLSNVKCLSYQHLVVHPSAINRRLMCERLGIIRRNGKLRFGFPGAAIDSG